MTHNLVMWAALACSSSPPPAPPAAAPVAAPAPAATAASEVPLYEAGRVYEPAELADMSLRELSLRRNTIYARVGQPFTKRWLVDYFGNQPWYVKSAQADLAKLSDTDRQNAERIGRTEASFTADQLRARLPPLIEARKAGTATPEQLLEIRLLNSALGEDDPGGAAGAASVGDVAAAGAPGKAGKGRGRAAPLGSPASLRHEIAPAELEDLSQRDLRLLRNTIFAVHGKVFKTELMKSYFAQKAWYHPDPKYSEADLTDLDRANLATIVAEENQRGNAGGPGGGPDGEPPFAGA